MHTQISACRLAPVPLLPILIGLLVLSQAAFGQQQRPPVPGAATPGGVQPVDRDKWNLPSTSSEVVPIPPVVDRPIDPESCPCVQVREFRLQGAVERPDLGISVANAQALLDNRIAGQPERGFTFGELEGIAADLANYYRNNGLILAQAFVPVQTVDNGIVAIEVMEIL